MNREAGLLAGGAGKSGVGVSESGSKGVPDLNEQSAFNDLNEQSVSTILTNSEGRLNDLNAAHRAAPAVYSIFTGRKPYLDEYLAEQGKLIFVDSLEKVDLIQIVRRRGVGDCGGAGAEEFVPKNPN